MITRPTLEAVALRAGVSRATASRVVNGQPNVDPALRDKVMRAVTDLGYVPNRHARTLVTQRTDMIALVIAEDEGRVFGGDPFFTDIIRGVSEELAPVDVQLVLMLVRGPGDYDRIVRYLTPGQVDGVLMISQHHGDPLPARLVAAGVPLVIGGRPVAPGLSVPHVDHDNVMGARLATEHLVQRGRRRIGTVAGPADMTAGQDRLRGFRQVLGDDVPGDRIVRGAFTYASGVEAAARLLDTAGDLDAVFAANDLMALGCLATLRRRGVRVPDDVAVVGYDGIQQGAEAEPALTTVVQRTVDQGRVMARMLLARTHAGAAVHGVPQAPDAAPGAGPLPAVGASDEVVVLPVDLVVRASS